MGFRNNKSIADQYLNTQPLPLQQPLDPIEPQLLPTQSIPPQPISMPQTSGQNMPIKPEFIDSSKSIERPTLKEQEPQQPLGPVFMPLESSSSTTTNTNQSQSTGVDPKSAAAIRQAVDAEQKATMDLAQVQAQKMEQTALSKEEQAAIQGQQIDAEKQAREEQRAKEIEAQKQLDASAQEMLKFEFDQNRVWKRATTGGSIAAGIGIALGALAQGFGAKSNAALDAIDKQINRDIEQQRMEYEKIKDKTKAQESAYGRLRQLGFDDAQTRAQLNKASLDQIQTKLEVGLAKLGVEEAPLIAAQATAAARTKLEDSLKGTLTQSKGSTSTKTIQKEMKQIPAMSGRGLRDFDGKPLSGEMAKQVGFMDGFLSDIQIMKQAVQKGDNRYKIGKDNEFTRANRRASENLGRLQSGGAVTEGEMKIFEGIMKGFWDNPQEALVRLQEQENIILGRRKAVTPSPFVSYHGNTGSGRPVE